MNDIKVSYFHISRQSLDNVILAWWVSRTERTFEELLGDLESIKIGKAEYNALLADILQQDLPVREFVPIFFVVENAPRSFVDQLDRSRVGWAFWEQSLRQRDLNNKFEYFIPPEYFRPENKELLDDLKWRMNIMKEGYELHTSKGINRDSARGMVPIHINVRLSAQCNLRSLLNILRGRMCYFAQGDYWSPIAQGLLKGLWGYLPSLRDRKVLTMPCTGKQACPFEKDILDRIEDKSNPVCPILILDFLPDKYNKTEVVNMMIDRYPDYLTKSKEFIDSVRFCGIRSLEGLE